MVDTPKKKYKVLIVDDDKFLLDMYSVKFSQGGLEVETAARGEEAIEKIKKGFHPDVLIFDVVMPGMDGFEMLGSLKKQSLVDNTVSIVLSNQGQQSDIDKATALGADGYIVKASSIPSEVFSEVLKITESKLK